MKDTGVTMHIHKVSEGETQRDVASSYGVSPIKLAENNGISHNGRLIPGEELLILTPTRTVNARRGETLNDLALRFGVSHEALLAYNPELRGKCSLYDGQPLAVKHGIPSYGMGIGNGYYYRGCSVSKLVANLPYMSYVTVAAGVVRKGIAMLFDDKEIVSLAKAAGKIPLFRIYTGKVESFDEWCEMIKGLAILARARNYGGITLAGVRCGSGSKLAEWTVEAKKILLECDLKLFYEVDAEDDASHVDYADGGILIYDKIHKTPIPSFDEGEHTILREYAERHESLRTFVDLSPFAIVGGKYITKSEARDAILRSHGVMEQNEAYGYTVGRCGRGRHEKLYVFESMSNTKRKLEAVSEEGYYGISFDIARTSIYDLMMFAIMFSPGIKIT